ncbi:MAG: response regulator [Pirellulales bacterium]|nr:response regulator [Pirellulales bacterium]
MKQNTDFLLDHAAWPAILVDQSTTIRCANQAAIATFGATLENETPPLSSIWSSENTASPEQFINRAERSVTMAVPLKFKVRGGSSLGFHAYISPCEQEGKKTFIVQLLKELPAAISSTSCATPGSQSIEAGQAQKQKLDCAMQLIRTVVLDFNNALTSILGHTSLLLHLMDSNHPWRHSLLEVEKSAEKAAEIAHDLAAFSRQEKDTRSMATGNLNSLIRRVVEIFQTPGSPELKWTMDLENRLYAVQYDEAKMQQAFVKIIENAIQAVGADGHIVIHSKNMDLAEPYHDGTLSLAAGFYVCVDIADNGSGIASDTLPRIFEPFFTTKPNHRGLGLAWVYGIVTNHGGSVSVASVPDNGTTVRIFLPAVKRFVKDLAINTDELTGAETILMVDDEDLLLTMGQVVLSSFGYNVITANSGDKAFDIFSQMSQQIDLVITDLVMPNMSGRELIERMRRISPNLKMICCSGFVRPASNEEDEIYLQKPFTSQELLRKVKEVLSPLELT